MASKESGVEGLGKDGGVEPRGCSEPVGAHKESLVEAWEEGREV